VIILENNNGNTITLSKDTAYGAVILVLTALLVVSVFTSGFGIIKAPTGVETTTTNQTQPTTQPTNQQPPAQQIQQLTVAKGNLPLLGQENAAVTIVEFSDFQCPFCQRLVNDALAQIKTNYINTGKAKLYFRDFPLSFHPNALPAANAARCANEQGKFWEMHDKLFQRQSAWSSSPDAKTLFVTYATELGLNNASFESCYSANKYTNAIAADESEGQRYGVQGTPGTFLLLPKSKVNAEEIKTTFTALNDQFRQQGGEIYLFENSNEYVVLIPGAYPYSAFDAFLSKVRY
jgi:protein-disulfide isomerase